MVQDVGEERKAEGYGGRHLLVTCVYRGLNYSHCRYRLKAAVICLLPACTKG